LHLLEILSLKILLSGAKFHWLEMASPHERESNLFVFKQITTSFRKLLQKEQLPD
jgi:hypothetical protein